MRAHAGVLRAREARPAPPREAAPGKERFLEEVLDGLGRSRKSLPCKYFYDARGSRLFEEICGLEEYYLTRTELRIMKEKVREMAAALGPRCLLIEYGSGSGRKTRLLLDHMRKPVAYVPIDISEEMLRASSTAIAEAYPDLEVHPLYADYTNGVRIPSLRRAPERRGARRAIARRAIYFPGSTIGNFTRPQARTFLSRAARLVGPGGGLLIGVDLVKDRGTLEAAYDDRLGVTARFNLNLLERINRELGGDFRARRFRHRAIYNARAGRIEMHLVSLTRQTVHIGGRSIPFEAGEMIHTENSYKYTLRGFRALAARAGWSVRNVWSDPDRLFSVQYLGVSKRR